MEYKVELNSLDEFKAWSGARETLNVVRERGGIEHLTCFVRKFSQEQFQLKVKSMTGYGLMMTISIAPLAMMTLLRSNRRYL